MKEFGPPGGARVPGAPPLCPPMVSAVYLSTLHASRLRRDQTDGVGLWIVRSEQVAKVFWQNERYHQKELVQCISYRIDVVNCTLISMWRNIIFFRIYNQKGLVKRKSGTIQSALCQTAILFTDGVKRAFNWSIWVNYERPSSIYIIFLVSFFCQTRHSFW